MINKTFKTFQADLIFLINPSKYSSSKDERERRILFAAVRVFGVLGMGVSIASGSLALLSGRFFVLTASAALFTLGHDFFTISKNLEKGPISQLGTVASNFLSDAIDLWNGEKNESSIPRHYAADGTILRPIWDSLFWELQNKK